MPNLLALRFNSLFGKEVNYSRPKDQIDPNLLAKAISLHESGGRQVKGASGEFGSFQFMPGTWTQICKQVMGEVLPQTPENEQFVAQRKITQLVQKFGNIQDVAKVWNTSLGGKEEPLSVKGVNKKGVKYDSVAYAKKVQAVYDSLSKPQATTTPESQVAAAASPLLSLRTKDPLHYIRPNTEPSL